MSKNKSPPDPLCILRGHEGVVTALHFTSGVDDAITEKPSLISGSDCGEIFVWSLKNHRTYHRFKGHNGKMILYLDYHKSSIISQGRDGCIRVWKFIENEWNTTRVFNSSSYGFCAASLFLTEPKTYLVTPTGEQSSMTFYDYDTTMVLHTYNHKENDSQSNKVSGMCMCMKVFMRETKMYLLMGYDDGFLTLWDYDSNKEISRLKCHQEVLLCLDFDSVHKNRGISGSVDDALQAWKVGENLQLKKVHTVTITNPGINAVKIRNDGKICITAGQDKKIRVFSWKSLKPLAVLAFHRKPVFSLTLNNEPFGKYSSYFASGAKDNNVCIGSIF